MIIPHDVAVGQTIEIAAPCKLMILGVRNYTHGGSAPIQVIELALDDGVVLTAGVDVQKDGLVATVVAHDVGQHEAEESDDEPEAPHEAEESDDAHSEAQGDDEGHDEAEETDEADAT